MQEVFYTDLIAKYLSGNIEAPERERLLAWIAASDDNRAYFDELMQLWSAAEYEPAFIPQNEAALERAWLAVEQKISPAPHQAPVFRLSFNRTALRVAAAVLLLLGVAYWLWSPGSAADTNFVAITTGVGESREVLLPDGSTVWMNEKSRLEYKSDFEKRQVMLDGEAFFEVRKDHGKTFTIRSGEALTTVLGTSFNVRAYPNEGGVEVTVKTGKVELKVAETPERRVLLLPGDAGVFEKQEGQVSKVEKSDNNSDAWKTHSLAFKTATVAEVIETLERYYEVDIEVTNEAILKCRFQMDAQQNPMLENIFKLMDFTMNLKISLENGQYILNGDGC